MSDKTKFGDLFEKIAKDTGSSPEVIRELKKQMGIELRESLKKDGSTHLGGLGTFYLKWSEEREGINPQTGETIEIPAHNHISFRPDASVRRRINKENENLKTFILDDSGNKEPEVPAASEEPKTKIPFWMWVLLALLALGLIFAWLTPPKEVVREVPVIEEVVVIEEVPVIEEVVIIEEVVVTNEVVIVKEVPVIEEVVVIEEIIVVNEAPAAQEAKAPVQAATTDNTGTAGGAKIDPMAEAEAGMAEGEAEVAVDNAKAAAEKAEQSGSDRAVKNAEEAVDEAKKAIAKEIEADKRAAAAAKLQDGN